jgi:hypothetical protein
MCSFVIVVMGFAFNQHISEALNRENYIASRTPDPIIMNLKMWALKLATIIRTYEGDHTCSMCSFIIVVMGFAFNQLISEALNRENYTASRTPDPIIKNLKI